MNENLDLDIWINLNKNSKVQKFVVMSMRLLLYIEFQRLCEKDFDN